MSTQILNSLLSTKNAAIEEMNTVQDEISNLYTRLATLHDRLSYYQGFVVDLEKRISLHAKEHAKNQPARINTNSQPSNVGIVIDHNSPKPRAGGTMSVKDMLIHILRGAPNGYDVRTILDVMRSLFGVNIPRTTVSPQLSRMKHEGLVQLRGEHWMLDPHYRNGIAHRSKATSG